MTSLSSVFVEVRPDTKGFSTELKASLAKTREAVDVAAKLDTSKIRPQIDKLKADLKTLELTKAKISADSTQATATIKSLKMQLRDLEGDVKINGSTAETTAKIEDIKKQIRDIGDTRARLNVDTGMASAHIKVLKAQLDALARSNPTVDVNVRDTKGINFAFRGISNLTTAIVGLAPVAVPALAAVTAGVGVLGSSLLTAGGAGGIFAASVVGQVSEMKKLQQNIDRISKLNDKYAVGTKEHAMYQDELNSATKEFNQTFGPAARGLDRVKDAWGKFLGATRSVTLGVMGKGLNLAADVLPRLVPLANAAGRAIGGLVDELARFTKTERFQAILDFFKRYGPQAITSFGHIAGNAILGVFNLFAAFAPYQHGFLQWLTDASERFRKWSEGFGSSNGFRSFMDYVKASLPQVKELFSNLIEFTGKFIVALGPLAGVELKVVTAFLKGLNSLPPKVLTAIAVSITAVVLGLKAWELGVKSVTIAQKLWTAAQWLFNVAMDANPIGLVILAVAGLVAGIIIAWKHSETFRKIVTASFDAVKKAAVAVWTWIKDNWKLLLAIITGPFGLAVIAIAKNWDKIKNGVKGALLWILDKVSDFAVKVLGFMAKAFGWAGPLGDKLKSALAQVKAFRAAVNAELDGIKDEPVTISIKTIRAATAKNDRMLGRSHVGGAGPIPRSAIRGAMGGSGILPRVSAPMAPVRSIASGAAQTRSEIAMQAAHKIQDQLKAAHVKALKAALASGPRGKAGHVLPAGSYTIGMPYHGYPGHNGADYPAPIGTPVSSPWAGRVVISRDLPGSNPYNSTPFRSYGRYIKIQHANGLSTLYGHLSQRGVAAGAMVAAGQFIGRVGMNGNATGPHLHWETARNGVTFNPASLHIMDTGGMLRSGGAAVNLSGRNERVLTPRQTDVFERMVNALEAGGEGGNTFQVYETVSPGATAREIARVQRFAGGN